MKNLFKVLGIVAVVAVIGFAFVSCGEPNNNTSNPNTSPNARYTMTQVKLTNTQYQTIFGGTAPTAGQSIFLSGNKATVSANVATACATAPSFVSDMTDKTYVEVSEFIDTAVGTYLTSAQAIEAKNKISSQGFFIMARGLDGADNGNTGIMCAVKQ